MKGSIEKDQTLRTGNWERWPLNAEQQQYAALDAYASLLIYQVSIHANFALDVLKETISALPCLERIGIYGRSAH